MKKLYIIILSLIAFCTIACEPEAYTGPLDSPIGNWEGIRSEYYFNGEKVADIDTCCNITSISFYKQGLCCIGGVKGTFPFIYDNSSGDLQIDSTLWKVEKLIGTEMIIRYIDKIWPLGSESTEIETVSETPVEPEVPEIKPDKNGIILPYEYNGVSINSDDFGYFYINELEETIYCNYKGTRIGKEAAMIDFWYDSSTNYFIPLVVEEDEKKK